MGEGGKEEKRDFQWLTSLAYVPSHSIFYQWLDKDRVTHQTTQQMTQKRENAQDSKTQNKKKTYISRFEFQANTMEYLRII